MQKITSQNLDKAISYAYKLRDNREYKKAFKLAQACLREFPTEAKIHTLLGMICFADNKTSEASKWLRTAIKFNPTNAENYYLQGLIDNVLGLVQEAILSFKTCLEHNPQHVDALYQLGSIYVKQKNWKEAIDAFHKIIAIDPTSQKAYNNIGVIYHMLNSLSEAIVYYEKSLSLGSDVNTLANLGAAYTKTKQLDKAISSYEQALAFDPKAVSVITNLAGTYFEMGEFKKAEKYFRQILDINPNVALQWLNLSICSDYESEDNPDINQIRINLINPNVTEEEKAVYFFALGNIYDKLKKYETAFQYYKQGNDLQGKKFDFKPDVFLEHIQQITKVFLGLDLKPYAPAQASEITPLFIVGMPQTGKKLLETLLSSHPSIASAGDIGLADVINKIPEKERPEGFYPFWLKTLKKDQAIVIRDYYFNRLVRDINKSNCKYVIDTMPGNFMYIGLLHRLFPKAKFIVCQRTPLDVGLAIYFKYFLDAQAYTCDLKKIGQFYVLYQLMISFWKEIIPHSIIEFHYESLVGEPQKSLDLLMQFLNFSGHQQFNLSKLTSDKIGSSKHYRNHLNPLITILANRIASEPKTETHKPIYIEKSELTSEQKNLLLSPFLNKTDKFHVNESRLLIESKVSDNEELSSFDPSSKTHFFSDLSFGKYCVYPKEDKSLSRIRAWDFLFKKLPVVDSILKSNLPQVRVLDLGCSSGSLRRILEGNIEPNVSRKLFYWGVDNRRDKLEQAVNGVNDIESGAQGNLIPSAFLLHDIQFGLPFKDASFDYVICLEMIKHPPIEQSKLWLDEVKRVLEPSGLIYLSMPVSNNEAFEIMLASAGLSIINKRGSQSIVDGLDKKLSHEHTALFKDLLTIYPAELIESLIIPLYPHLSEQIIYVCRVTDGSHNLQ